MTTELNRDRTVAVDRAYYWQPIATCPRGVKVQLLGAGGVAVYGTYNPPRPSEKPWWTHWAPLPVLRKENKDAGTKTEPHAAQAGGGVCSADDNAHGAA